MPLFTRVRLSRNGRRRLAETAGKVGGFFLCFHILPNKKLSVLYSGETYSFPGLSGWELSSFAKWLTEQVGLGAGTSV